MSYSKEFMNETIKELTNSFVHLHVHSEYSNLRLLDSTNKIDNMIKYVSNLGQNGIALTDHESLSGHVKFIQAIKKFKKEGVIPNDFKGILGNEIYLVDEYEMNKQINDKEYVPFYHFLLLAKNSKGHHMLRQLSSKAWERMFSYKGMDRVPTFYSDLDEIVKEQGHLIGSTACLGSYFARRIIEILNQEDEEKKEELKYEIDDFINWCIDIFGKEDFYIEIQPSQEEVQKSYNKYALIIAKAYGLKYIITTDAHYLNKDKRNIHKAYLTSSEEEEGNREVDAFYNSTHFFSTEELFQALDYLEFDEIVEGIKNTKEIANKIEEYDLFNKQTIPLIPVSDKGWEKDKNIYSYFKDYEYITKMINNKENIYDRYLIYLATLGIKDRKIPKEEYRETFERMDLECKEIIRISEIKEEPISGYFITMVKNIDIIWENAEAIIPPGRGSAGGYILNYLLGITQVNPLKQGIEMPHFRFISAERPDLPDIDIDIPSHKRNRVFSEVLKYYKSIGGDIVRVCTFGTETAKSAIQTACRG